MTKGGIDMYWWVVVIVVVVASILLVSILLTKRKNTPVERTEDSMPSSDTGSDKPEPDLEPEPESEPSPEFDTAGPPQTQPASEIGPHGGEFGTFEAETAERDATPDETDPRPAGLPEAFPDPDPTSDLFIPSSDQIADTGAPSSPSSSERS